MLSLHVLALALAVAPPPSPPSLERFVPELLEQSLASHEPPRQQQQQPRLRRELRMRELHRSRRRRCV